MKRNPTCLRRDFPEKAVMSHSMYAEHAEQSGSESCNSEMGGDTRIRDFVY